MKYTYHTSIMNSPYIIVDCEAKTVDWYWGPDDLIDTDTDSGDGDE